MFWRPLLVKWNGGYCTKNVTLALKSWSQNASGLCSPYASWFTKDQEGHKIYWASGNRVLDAFSTIQYMTICCLCHVNIIMPSAIWLELALKFESGSVQNDKNVAQNTRPSFTHMWRFGHETTPKCVTLFLDSASKLSPKSPSEAFLHFCLQSYWKNI